ncbi:MAG: hypothetical protein ACLFV6_02950 [Spirulinaceae cyanobacterium]
MADEFCFGTLAVGDRYRKHAKLLAQDIQKYAPTQTLIVLTDRPQNFQEYSQVLAFPHQLQSVKGYHDKRFVLEKALSLFETCVLLDADVRIIGPVSTDLTWPPGITARAGCSLGKQLQDIRKPYEIEVIQKAAQHLNLDVDNVQWLHEFMFAMSRQDGKEQEFFQLWQTISYFFETQGIYYGEGYAMGFAAAKVGLDFGFDRSDWFPFFKDNIEQVRIKNGQSQRQEKQPYFDTHYQIEYPLRSVPQKVWAKLQKFIALYPRLWRLRKQKRQDIYYEKLFGKV